MGYPLRRLLILLLTTGLLLTTVLASAGPVAAAKGGNSDNAKLCYKGGYAFLYKDDGRTFTSQDECVAFAAQGGTLLTQPPLNVWQQFCTTVGTNGAPSVDTLGYTDYPCTGVTLDEATASLISAATPACIAVNPNVPSLTTYSVPEELYNCRKSPL